MKINIKCVLNLMPSGGLRQVVALQRISLLGGEKVLSFSEESISCWF